MILIFWGYTIFCFDADYKFKESENVKDTKNVGFFEMIRGLFFWKVIAIILAKLYDET